MIPSEDQTGTPKGFDAFRHLISSTTSGTACLTSPRIRASTSPRQSPSSSIFASISSDGVSGWGWGGMAGLFQSPVFHAPRCPRPASAPSHVAAPPADEPRGRLDHVAPVGVDGVVTLAARDVVDGVVARAERVVAPVVDQPVAAGSPDEDVVSAAAIEAVAATPSLQAIVALTARLDREARDRVAIAAPVELVHVGVHVVVLAAGAVVGPVVGGRRHAS